MVHRVSRRVGSGWVVFLPLRQGYAVNVHKVQGLQYDHVSVYFDVRHAPPGVGYVAVSRVGYLERLAFLGVVSAAHFPRRVL